VRSSVTFRHLRQLASFFLIPDAYAGWFPFALEAAAKRLAAGGVDVLFTTSSPDTSHLVGLVLRERHPVPWVADFRDPWVRRLTFAAPTRAHERLHHWLEQRVLERADRVIVTNDETRDDFLRRHPMIPFTRFAVIPNGFDPEDLVAPGLSSPRPGPRPATDDRPLVLVHTGLLSGRRTISPLLAGIEHLLAARPELRPRLRVRQVGPRESVNDELVLASGLREIVTFMPPVDHRQILAEMVEADALLLLEADEPKGSLITPGKIFEYLASGRPLLALVPEGPAAALVRAAGGGEVVSPGASGHIAEVLARWLDHGPPATPSREAFLADYSRPALAARLASLLDSVTRDG
jgi:glycosyltransferase involved in cell wall biosynthesis